MTNSRIGRRTALLGGVAAVAAPSVLRAQTDPIKIATLTPLTGAGGPYGPVMAKVAAAVVEEVNAAGGVLGRKVVLVSEDDQTNPDVGVRAARKLIDVDKVSAILGTWASSVTTAVAPLCWESKTFLCTVSGADSITLLPHQGYLVRTQPNTVLQVTRNRASTSWRAWRRRPAAATAA
jgi:branched-chain amino acid transport system substrate-binding protein